MNLKKLITSAFFISLILIISCERKSRPIAARKGTVVIPQEMSEDVSSINVSSVSAIAGIEEVLPLAPGKTGPINGEALYQANCVACHQVTGQGIPGAFPPLVNSPYILSENKDRLAAIMLYGLMGPINVLGTTYNGVMTAVGMTAKLSNEELAGIANYVRTSWGNKADTVDPTVFENVRKKYGTRGPFNIQELGEEK